MSTAPAEATLHQPKPLTPHQREAVERIAEWYASTRRGQGAWARMEGGAGTGKTEVFSQLPALLGLKMAQYLTPTARAADVLLRRGVCNASTAHSALYVPKEEWEDGRPVLYFENQINEKLAMFDLILLDEGSMVSRRIGQDLMRAGARVLVSADPFQLPPVDDEQAYFLAGQPVAELREPHRQALDNPIIAAATALRERREVNIRPYADGERLRVFGGGELSLKRLAEADQVIVGRHKMRRHLNRLLRSFAGHPEDLPLRPGAKLVITRNNRDRGLWNGVIYQTTAEMRRPNPSFWRKRFQSWLNWGDNQQRRAARIMLSLIKEWGEKIIFSRFVETAIVDPSDRSGKPHWVPLYVGEFEADAVGVDLAALLNEREYRRDHDLCRHLGLVRATWGYAVTCHKMQGSQAPHIAVIDDGWGRGLEQLRWRYTAYTRAEDRLDVYGQTR